jgi:hypothetical protein
MSAVLIEVFGHASSLYHRTAPKNRIGVGNLGSSLSKNSDHPWSVSIELVGTRYLLTRRYCVTKRNAY